MDVDLKLKYEIDQDDALLETADKIIVATGAVPLEIDIPGIDGDNVVEVLDAHLDHELIKEKESLFVVVAYLAAISLSKQQLNMIKMSL